MHISKPDHLKQHFAWDDWHQSPPAALNEIDQGGWHDGAYLHGGRGLAPHALAIDGSAAASVEIGLTALVPNDYAAIHIAIGNAIDFDAFGRGGAVGSITTTAVGSAQLTIEDGKLVGGYTATLSVELTAELPSSHAVVHLRVTDSFSFTLSGKGWSDATLATTANSEGTVQTDPTGDGPAACGRFDLAQFAASVLGTGDWSMKFVASQAGTTLQGKGVSTLSIDATADLPGGWGGQHLSYHDVQRSAFAFDAGVPTGGPGCWIPEAKPAMPPLFHH